MNKRNLTLILSLVGMLIVGIIALAVGFAISGVDIGAWLGSHYAVTIYIVVGVFGIGILFMLLYERNRKL